ncbi:unnamed protein product, partial [Meganyctiphanes norvegica]
MTTHTTQKVTGTRALTLLGILKAGGTMHGLLGGDLRTAMKDGADNDKDSGSVATLDHAGGLPGYALGGHRGASRHHNGGHLAAQGAGGLSAFPGLHHSLQLAALSSQQQAAVTAGMLYPMLGNNLMASLTAARGSAHHPHIGFPPTSVASALGGSSPALAATLHAHLAAADSSRQRDNFFDQMSVDMARQRELLVTLSKLATSSQSGALPQRGHRPGSPGTYSSNAISSGGSIPMSHSSLGATLAAAATTGGLSSETPSPTAGSSPPSTSINGYTNTGTPNRKASTSRPDRVFTCKVCNRSFGYKHVLQNHERTHTGEKPFECKECHKRFTRDHHLKTHMRLHTGEKPYHCTHCDRQFVQVANLRRHLRVHTGERPYACELCVSRFSDSNQLKAHMLIHKGEKPFQCVRCLGRFRRRHHLMHHKCPKILEMESQYGDSNFTDTNPYSLGPEQEGVDGYPEEEATTTSSLLDSEPIQLDKKRERKNPDPRRVLSHHMSGMMYGGLDHLERSDPSSLLRAVQTALPEQTEPEDLSLAGTQSRNRNYSGMSAASNSSRGHRPEFQISELDYSRESLSNLRREDNEDAWNYSNPSSRGEDNEDAMS